MATIPIEVIIQDAESPVTPTPESGEETNITVPDTGSGIGNIFTGSASSIILPAILLVLAICSIAIILIHKYHKQKKDKTTRKEKLAVATSSTVAILAVTALIGNLVIPATKAATSDIEDGVVPSEDKVSITVTRDGGVAEASIESTATITSTSDFGYKVLLSMAEGVETSNLYLNGDETSEHYIAPVEVSDDESEAEGTVLADNTWGYALTEGGGYSAMPLLDNAATVAEGDEPVEDELLRIYYGVKVSSDLPAGTYSGGEIEYTLEAVEPTINALVYLQDFAKLSEDSKNSVLGSMVEETTYTLKDKRDEQDYTIAKLKDGRVWMTKNLNLAGGSEITSELSDVPDGYVLPVENGFQEGNKLPVSDPYSFDNNDRKASVYNTENISSDCADPGCYSYYSWVAVTVGSGVGITVAESDALYSICPKGWKLPNSRSDVTERSDFYQLAVAYGMDPSNSNDYSSTTGSNFYNNAGPNTVPNFLVTGYYDNMGPDDSSYKGGYAEYWASTFAYDGGAKYLSFNSSTARTSSTGVFREGRAVRCLVK